MLSNAQVEAVLSRNTDLRARVLEFNTLVATLGWDQVRTAPGFLEWDFTIPGAIPPEGIYVIDPQLGNVVVFPDAAGVLRYNVSNNVGSAHLVSPSGLPPLPSLPAITGVIALVAIAFIVFELAPIVMIATARRSA